MTESNFQSVSGIPMMVIIAFLLVYGGLYVLFQVDLGISMFAGFLAAIIVYVFKYTSLLEPLQEKEEE